MSETWIQRQTVSDEDRRLYEQERLVFGATEIVTEAMAEQGVSKADLARRLGTSRANVTGLLSGERNLTLRTISDLAFVLGQRITMSYEPLRQGEYVSSPARIVRPRRTHVSVIEARTGDVVENDRGVGQSGTPANFEGMAA